MATEVVHTRFERRAILVFADATPLDLCRRKWPKNFQSLLKLLPLDSSWPAGIDTHFFSSLGLVHPTGSNTYVHTQMGSTFAERLENAIEELAGLGYDEIVIIGRDCPDLETSDILLAFSRLDEFRLVLGPDHCGGCYLIAFHASERELFRDVHWQQNSDCNELENLFGRERTFKLSVKQDLDTFDDVQRLARSTSRWCQVAEGLLEALDSDFRPFQTRRVDSRHRRLRLRWQLPPPSPSPL